ncbi:MAG TPA: alpha/beta hydrolase [Anaerolineales bacterium]|nr:alpha/beta hydrolase [Anaerolineales bacterium]
MSLHTLSDGRQLAWAEYGDPLGKAVFFFHGAPGSRLFHPPDEVTRRMGVRLVCIDRPGYGGSTFQPQRRLLDWPEDVASLADELEIDSFILAGHSAGAPHALACAYRLPQRVTAVGVLSGAGPVDLPGAVDGLARVNWLGFRFGRYVPWPLLHGLTRMFFGRYAADPSASMLRNTGARLNGDEQILASPEVREICLQSDVEACRQGLKGFAWDVRLITRAWGFPLEEIQVPVHLWHGTADTSTSIRMAQAVMERLPQCSARIYEGEGHMLLIPRWEEILSVLTRAMTKDMSL